MPLRVPEDIQERRVEYLAPLVAYLRERHYIAFAIVEEALNRAVAAGEEPMRVHPNWMPMMQRGQRRVPPWLVEQCCAVIGRPVEEVMGAAWVTRFGADGHGGTEVAPTSVVRRQRPWSVQTQERADANNDSNDSKGSNAA